MSEQHDSTGIEQGLVAGIKTRMLAQPWLALAIVLVLITVGGAIWWQGSEPSQNGADTAQSLQGRPADTVVELAPVATQTPPSPPTPTPLPTPTALAVIEVPLPTVTPTPIPDSFSPRAVNISGNALLRLSMANPNYQSSGRSVDVAFETRTLLLDTTTPQASDSWCVQMGLVNLQFDLQLAVVDNQGNLGVSGTLSLYDDFCVNPGTHQDTITVDYIVPADAILQAPLNLQSQRNLLNVPGLLDTRTTVIIELRIGNSQQ
jgi:hypothetical protein